MRALVQMLNDNGIRTFDSCCGHGARWGHITIGVADATRARALGFRVCEDAGATPDCYPFVGTIGDTVNIFLPPLLVVESASIVRRLPHVSNF